MPFDPTVLPPNTLKLALKEGRRQLGFWTSLCSNVAAEILAGSGFDWILIDTEHAPNDVFGIIGQLQAMMGGSAEPVVRVAWNDTVLIKRILDIGARSLLVPFVQNADEARHAVAATRYPRKAFAGRRRRRNRIASAESRITIGRRTRTSASWSRWRRVPRFAKSKPLPR